MNGTVVHWTLGNGSGLDKMARSMHKAELALGMDSRVVVAPDEDTWQLAAGADIHVCHVHFPDKIRERLAKPPKIVWIGHGTPEHVFASSVAAGDQKIAGRRYGFGDSFQLLQHWLTNADELVTFWPRHQAIYETMVGRNRTVRCIPFGLDRTFWEPGESRGKFGGTPSVFTAENGHRGKWPLDLLLAWPWVAAELYDAVLHVCNLTQDEHRWWFPLANMNGAHFRAYLSDIRWSPEDLRNVFRSIDYFIGLVEYGDHNHLMMQAHATGAKCISYRGNEYADYWLTPGDQRVMAQELLAILKGRVEPRQALPAPDIADTARAMQAIYEPLLLKQYVPGFRLTVPALEMSEPDDDVVGTIAPERETIGAEPEPIPAVDETKAAGGETP